MTQVQMKDGQIRCIRVLKDFPELIDDYMGSDCRHWAEENLHEESELEVLEDQIYELEDKVAELEQGKVVQNE